MIHHLTGDVLDAPAPCILAHVVNDCGAFGAGVAGQIAARWPAAKIDYLRWHMGRLTAPDFKLGAVRFFPVQERPLLLIAHLLAQRGLPSKFNSAPLDYAALATALETVARRSEHSGLPVHMPRIGAGLARGDWDRIEGMIGRIFEKVHVHIYTLPEAP